MMNSTIQVCGNCHASLALGLRLHFCPYCGTVQIERKVLATKTTQNYDPSNPQHKPWRDKSHIPKRNYTHADVKAKQPWCPAMRQPQKRNKPSKVKYQFQPNQVVGNTSTPQPEIEVDSPPCADGAEEDGATACAANSSVDQEEYESVQESFTEFYTEAAWPVAVYDAEHWTAVSGMTVNLSLVEQTIAASCHNYWLRVGVLFADQRISNSSDQSPAHATEPDDTNATEPTVEEGLEALDIVLDEQDSPQGNDSPLVAQGSANHHSGESPDQNHDIGGGIKAETLYTLAVLSGDVAKWMIPNMGEWVELSAVDPLEYYMARHMEHILEAIAHRVVTTNLNEQALRRVYCVELRRKTKLTKFESTLTAVSGLSIDAIERFVKNTPTTTTSWGYNANQVVCTEVTAEAAGPPSALMSRTAESLSVSILDWVVQFSHRLVLTRGIAIRSYPSLVRVSFRYADRLVDPHEFRDQARRAIPEPDLLSLTEKEAAAVAQSSKYVDPRFAERQRRIERFSSSQRVTHVVLIVTPTAVSLEDIIAPAEFAFDLASLKVLLQRGASTSWDELLADGKKSTIIKLAKKLCNLIRLEYSDRGLQYSVIGAFSDPSYTSCAWPHDAPEYLNEDLEDLELEEGAIGVPLQLSGLVSPARDDTPALLAGLDLGTEESAQGWSDTPSPTVEPSEPSSPVAVTRQDSLLPVSSDPSPEHWACPFHPTSGSIQTCLCVRQQATLRGSELWVFANAIGPPVPAATGAERVIAVPVYVSLSDCSALLCTVCSAGEVQLRVFDLTDETLHCDAVVPAAMLSALMQESTAHYGTASPSSDVTKETVDQERVTYTVSDHNVVAIDMGRHSILLKEVVASLFDSPHVDLFLSRKTRHMKLVIK